MRTLILGSKEFPPMFRIEGCGGIEVHVGSIVPYLIESGAELYLITRNIPGQARTEHKARLNVYRVPYLPSRLLRTFSFNLFAFPISIYLTFRYRIALIHANDFVSGLFGALAARIARRPLVLSAPTFGSKQPEWPTIARICLLAFETLSLGEADKIFLFTPRDIEYAEKRLKLDRRKIELLGNGIDTARFDLAKTAPPEELGLPKNHSTKVIMFVGRLTKSKGLEVLLDAFKTLTERLDAFLVLIGDGPQRDALLRKAAESNIADHVFFAGKRTDVERLLGLADVFVLPSLYEGFPIALLEAMAAKRAIVATNVGAVPAIIRNGINGILVNSGNAEELSDAIARLLTDEEKRLRISEEAYRTVRERYSWRDIGEKVYEAYSSLVRSPH